MKRDNAYRPFFIFARSLVVALTMGWVSTLFNHLVERMAIVVVLAVSGTVLAAYTIHEIFETVGLGRERLKKSPGNRLMSIVTFLYSPADVEKTFKPTLADWHKEYFESLAAHRLWKSRWINVRYCYRFALAMGLSKAWKLIDVVIKAMTSEISK